MWPEKISKHNEISKNFSSVQFSLSVVSDYLRSYRLQHARPPCPSPTPSLLRLMSIESVMSSNRLILCCLDFRVKQAFLIWVIQATTFVPQRVTWGLALHWSIFAETNRSQMSPRWGLSRETAIQSRWAQMQMAKQFFLYAHIQI